MTGIVIIISITAFFIFGIYLMIGIPYRVKRVLLRYYRKDASFYHQILSTHYKYYNRLSDADKERFLWRTFQFVNSKRFHFIGLREREEMSILVSATAVQLSFGMQNFMLDFFKDIYIFRNDYHYAHFTRPLQGHVNRHGIYLTWQHFVKGMNGMEYNANLGLHEMAHAYTFVNFVTRCGIDRHFYKQFKAYSAVARPLFQQMQNGRKTILGDYAATNYHEFWAVSVEVFFENPVLLRHELPELYEAISQLLNQDPLFFISQKRMVA